MASAATTLVSLKADPTTMTLGEFIETQFPLITGVPIEKFNEKIDHHAVDIVLKMLHFLAKHKPSTYGITQTDFYDATAYGGQHRTLVCFGSIESGLTLALTPSHATPALSPEVTERLTHDVVIPFCEKRKVPVDSCLMVTGFSHEEHLSQLKKYLGSFDRNAFKKVTQNLTVLSPKEMADLSASWESHVMKEISGLETNASGEAKTETEVIVMVESEGEIGLSDVSLVKNVRKSHPTAKLTLAPQILSHVSPLLSREEAIDTVHRNLIAETSDGIPIFAAQSYHEDFFTDAQWLKIQELTKTLGTEIHNRTAVCSYVGRKFSSGRVIGGDDYALPSPYKALSWERVKTETEALQVALADGSLLQTDLQQTATDEEVDSYLFSVMKTGFIFRWNSEEDHDKSSYSVGDFFSQYMATSVSCQTPVKILHHVEHRKEDWDDIDDLLSKTDQTGLEPVLALMKSVISR